MGKCKDKDLTPFRYVQLTEVEDAFRTEKHDLGMRPIYHQKQDRTQAGLFFIAGNVEDPAAVDEDIRARHCSKKTH